MPAKLEIEVIDRGVPQQQQGGTAPVAATTPGVVGTPIGAAPPAAAQPPGHSQFPPGSVGDVAARWQQTGALNSVAGSVPGVASPTVTQVGSTPQPNTVELEATEPQSVAEQQATPPRAVDQAASPTGGGQPPNPPEPPVPVAEQMGDGEPFELTGNVAKLGWKHGAPQPMAEEQAEILQFNETGNQKKESDKDGQDPSAGLDRLLWQGGFGKLGNLAAMVDKAGSMPENATGFQRAAAGVGVAGAVSGVVGEAADAFSGSMQAGGSLAASVARNDMDTLRKVWDGFEGLARKVPVVGEAFGGIIGAITAPAKALSDVFGALVERGKGVGQYSGAISQAQAMQDVTGILQDIKEAQENEEGYAALIEAQTEFNTAWREAFEPVRKVLIEEMVAFMNENKEILRVELKAIARDMAWLVGAISNAIRLGKNILLEGGPIAGMNKTINDMLDRLDQINDRGKKKDPQGTLNGLYTLLSGVDRNVEAPPQEPNP